MDKLIIIKKELDNMSYEELYRLMLNLLPDPPKKRGRRQVGTRRQTKPMDKTLSIAGNMKRVRVIGD